MESSIGYWSSIIQFGILSAALLVANILRRKITIIKKTFLPTSVIAGFLLLLIINLGIINIDKSFMSFITYHTIAIGFIALTLRTPAREEIEITRTQKRDGLNSGVIIVSTYLIQGFVGLVITIVLSYIGMPGIFKAMGILLPMGYGQGPGQANNIGITYEVGYGYTGATSFALAIATIGFIWSCVGGIIYLNYLRKKGKYKEASYLNTKNTASENISDEGEIPLTEAIDKFTIQIALIFMIYMFTYIVSFVVCWLFGNIGILKGLEKSIVPLIWGFNFLIATVLTLLTKKILCKLKDKKWMNRKYTNNYMLNRMSGVCFDYMIVASIAIINIDDLRNLWIPFLIITTVGGIVTLVYLVSVTKNLYTEYEDEAMVSLYGMLTGTVSSGILLLREIDPNFETPASNNLVIGSANAILLGFPMLIFVGLAPQSDELLWVTLILIIIYGVVLNIYIFKNKIFKTK